MRFIKLIILSVLVFSIIVTGISLLIPSRIRIFKSIDINAPASVIFSIIKDTSKWNQWHPGYKSVEAQNSFYKLNSQIKTVENSDSIYTINIQTNKRTVLNTWQLLHFEDRQSSVLQWHIYFKLKWYPWEKLRSLFLEKTHGAMMEEGLSNLKKISE